MRRALIAATLASLAALAAYGAAGQAAACGSVRDWTAKYLAPAQSAEGRRAALVELSGCGGYYGWGSDLLLLPVLKDAVERGTDAALAQAVFDRYRCIPGARGAAGYEALSGALDTARCPTAGDRASWFVVRVDSAHLRAGPSLSAARIGHLQAGQVVERLLLAGDWFEVTSWAGASDITGYVHGSLLEPYNRR